MKKVVYIIFGAALLLSACKGGGNSAAAAKMADEMCQAMASFNDSDPMGMIEAASKMSAIAQNTEEYGKVTEQELLSAMKEKCPEGAAKFEELASQK